MLRLFSLLVFSFQLPIIPLSAKLLTFLCQNRTDNITKPPYLDYVRHFGGRGNSGTAVHRNNFLEPVDRSLSHLLHCPLLRPGFYETSRRSRLPRFLSLLRTAARAMGDSPAVPLLLFLLYGPSCRSASQALLDLKIGCGADVHLTPYSYQRASPSRAGRIDERHHRTSCRSLGRHLCSPFLRLFPPSSSCTSIGSEDSHA